MFHYNKSIKKIKNINILKILLMFILLFIWMTACHSEEIDYSGKIAHINEVMSDVPRLASINIDKRSSSEFGKDGLSFYDDWYKYYYDEDGYLSMAVLLSDRLTIVYEQSKKYDMKPTEDEIKSGVVLNMEERKLQLAEIIEGLNERAIRLHMMNMKNFLTQDRNIKSSLGGKIGRAHV